MYTLVVSVMFMHTKLLREVYKYTLVVSEVYM